MFRERDRNEPKRNRVKKAIRATLYPYRGRFSPDASGAEVTTTVEKKALDTREFLITASSSLL